MKTPIININFDRNKGPAIDFDILPFESILQRQDLEHNPRNLHRVHFYVLILITAGTGKHTIDFKEYDLSAGSVLTIRKNQIQRFHEGDAKGFMLLFTEEYVLSYLDKANTDQLSELFNELLYHQHSQLNSHQLEATLMLTHQIQQEFNAPLDDHTSGIIRSFLQILVSKMHRIRSNSSSLRPDYKYTAQFLEFQRLIETHHQKHRTVQYYADCLNVTPKTLNNITRSIIHKPAKQFIDELIILNIKRLLINTQLSVKEIAYQAGFDEPSNLFKFFKRYTASTPESFRKSHAQ